MAELSVASRRLGAAFRSRATAFLVLPLAALLPACGPSAGGGENDPDGDFLVLAATPTNSQETKNDLSDPELDQRVAVRFSTTPARSTMIDETNAFNGLTPHVQFLDQTFARVPGTPSIDPDTQAFYFEPENKNLVNGQYTLTISKFVASPTGNLLNYGVEDFSTSFTAGADTWSPVVRNYSPSPNQSDVPLYTPVVITFNESLDPASVVYGQTVFVQDGGTNPPTQLTGTISLKRDGFDLVYTPDPCTGMPPGTTVVVRMLGAGNTTYIKDRVGNGLVGDPLNNNEVSFQFNTRGVAHQLPTIVPAIASPKFTTANGYAIFASSNKKTVMFEVLGSYYDWGINGTIDPSFAQQVIAANGVPTLFGNPATAWGYTGSWGGDWEVAFDRAGEGILDWRIDPVTGLTYIYQVDEAEESVKIIDNFGKVQGRFKGLGTPKGLGISAPAAAGTAPVLFVSNYSQATLTGIPLGLIQPGKNICTAVKELNDDTSNRVFMATGKNPTGVALEYWFQSIGAVVNSADNSVQIFDPSTLGTINSLNLGALSDTYQVGANPLDAAWAAPLNGGSLQIGYIVNQGDADNPKGSVSIWWNQTSLIGLFNTFSGSVAATVTDGIDVPGRPTSDPTGLSCWIPNTAGETASRVDIQILGGYIGVALSATVSHAKVLGPNPTKVSWTGRYNPPVLMCFATLAGLGQVAVWEKDNAIGPTSYLPMPGCRSVFSPWDQ